VARRTFSLACHDPNRVRGVPTAVYFADAKAPVAPRPASSALELSKIEATGYVPADADEMLAKYVQRETRNAYATT
jgi:dTDP-4-dehydrorhamnose 3,5-epimerase